jgi:hypothetical protein
VYFYLITVETIKLAPNQIKKLKLKLKTRYKIYLFINTYTNYAYIGIYIKTAKVLHQYFVTLHFIYITNVYVVHYVGVPSHETFWAMASTIKQINQSVCLIIYLFSSE